MRPILKYLNIFQIRLICYWDMMNNKIYISAAGFGGDYIYLKSSNKPTQTRSA